MSALALAVFGPAAAAVVAAGVGTAAGAVVAAGAVLPFAAAGGIWWHNLPPTVHLAAGIHRGPIVVAGRERLVGDDGAVVLGGIVVRHSDVTIANVRVIGGENGIAIEDAEDVILDHVSVSQAALDGIHARHASVTIRHCDVDMRGARYGQGIDISYGLLQGTSIVDRCSVVGGRDGIVTHGSMAMFMHNHVAATTMTGISMTEMSMGEIERNTVTNARGIGILCGDRSMCTIAHNNVVGTRRDDATGNRMRAGFGVEVEFGAEADLHENALAANPRTLGVFLGSRIRWR
jgi:parallel beta-helix repeat protein